jgi:oxygen-dependent protoporphyrinogen oxidase
MDSIAIIGGGITGLTAAFRLRQMDHRVTVYEASSRLGGVIRSFEKNGYLAEFGPNTVLETSPRIAALIRDLGLESRKLYSDPAAANRYLVRGKRLVNLPSSPLAFLSTPLFSWSAKLRLLREPFIRPLDADAEESLATFVRRRIGQEFLDYAINPFVAGVYAGDPARLSVKHAFPKLHALEQKYGSLIKGQILGAGERRRRAEVSKQNAPKFSFPHGLQELIDALGDHLEGSIRLQSRVDRLRREGDRWCLTVQGQREVARHRAVLLAAPAYRLAEIELEGVEGSLASLGEIHYPPVASVVLGFRREDVAHPLDGFGVLIPEIERFQILGTIFSSSLFPHRAPPGHVTLTSYVGGTRSPELASRTAAELAALVTGDLRILLGVHGEPTFCHHVYYPRAIPQYEVGYDRFKRHMSHLEQRAPGLFFAGHYRDGISLGDSMTSGDDAANRIREYGARTGSDSGLAQAGFPQSHSA